MEVNLLRREEINTEKWNACIESNLDTASLSGMSWYLDKTCDNWNAVIIDDYQSIIPLPCRKKWGMNYVYPPFFAPRLGVFGQNLTAFQLDMILDIVSKQFKWIDMIFSPQTTINVERYHYLKHRAYVLNLQISYEQLQKQYDTNHRRNYKKALENQLSLIENIPSDSIISLFAENMGQSKKVGYTKNDYLQLKELIIFLQTKNAVEILGVADKDSNLCAGAFFTHKFGKYNFLLSGRTYPKVQNRSMYFLLDNFIRLHAESACCLQFNGSDNDNIAKIYAGFSAQETCSYQLTISRLNKMEKGMLSLLRKIRK